MMVFVSHAQEDYAFCREVVEGLRGAGADVWYDEHNMGPGLLMDTIEREMRRRPVFVLVLSPAALRSKWVHDECEWAYAQKKRDPSRIILPVVAEAVPDEDDIWMFMQGFVRIGDHGLKPYSTTSEAVGRVLHALGLTPSGEAPAQATSSLQSAESADDLVARGRALAAQRKFAEAVPLFKRAAELGPRSFPAWANLGWAYYEIGRYGLASDADDRALALDGKQAWVWNNKGLALHALLRTREALVAYERALTLGETAKRWTNKGNALYDLNHLPDALAAYDHALELDPSFALAWRHKSAALNVIHRYNEALAACERAIALDPSVPDAWSNKGNTLCGLRHYEEALTACEQAIVLDPSFAPAWSNKGLALFYLRRYEEALTAYKRAIALGETASRWQNAAITLRALGRMAEADTAERRARELSR